MSNTSGNCGLDTDRLRVKFRLSRWSRHSCWESRVGMWTVSTRGAGFSFESFCHEVPQTGLLEQHFLFFLLIVIETISLRLRNGQGWPPSGLVSTEASLLGLDMAVSSWCLYMVCLILTYEFQGGAQFGLQHFSNGHSMRFETGQAFIWWGKPPCHHFKLQPTPTPPPPTTCDFSWFNFICLQSTTVWKYWVESSRNKQKIMP